MSTAAPLRPRAPIAAFVPLWTGLAGVGLLAVLVAFQHSFAAGSIERNSVLALASALLAAAVIATSSRRWLGVPMVYLATFAVFHLGLAPILALGWKVPDFGNPFGTVWLSNRPVGEALHVVAVSVLCFSLGARGGAALGRRSAQRRSLGPSDSAVANRRCATLALVCAIAGVVGWFAFVFIRGGVGVFVGSYTNYNQVTAGGALPQLYLLITIAVALGAIVPNERAGKAVLVLVGVFAAAALPLGLRGEILFPLAAAVAMVAKRRKLRVRPLRIVVLCVLLLSLIALARSVRVTGVAELADRPVDVNPLHGMAELGYSLRPVAEALQWQQTTDQPANGRTYVRPLERAASRVVPNIGVPPADQDTMLTNVLVSQRVGPIGFSPVAEGVVNFGWVGAAGYMAIVGAVLAFLDARPASTATLAFTGSVLASLLIQTRNAFVPVPFQLALAVVIWLLVFRPSRRRRAGLRSSLPTAGILGAPGGKAQLA